MTQTGRTAWRENTNIADFSWINFKEHTTIKQIILNKQGPIHKNISYKCLVIIFLCDLICFVFTFFHAV